MLAGKDGGRRRMQVVIEGQIEFQGLPFGPSRSVFHIWLKSRHWSRAKHAFKKRGILGLQ